MTQMQLMVALAALGLLIILVLAVVAGRMLWLVRRQQQDQQQRLREVDERAEAQRERLDESVQLLAKALVAQQVGAAEASIRISVLLDAMAVDDLVREEFAVFWQLAARVDHIPTHDRWLALDKAERQRYRGELDALEEQFGSFARDAAVRLLRQRFDAGVV